MACRQGALAQAAYGGTRATGGRSTVVTLAGLTRLPLLVKRLLMLVLVV